MRSKPLLNLIVAFSLLVSVLAMAVSPPGGVQGPPAKAPQAPLATMPVFSILPTLVNHDIILRNSSRLNSVNATDVFTLTTPGGLNHFFAIDPKSQDLVEQYNRTGGFFAVNSTRAYTETTMTIAPTNTEICNFLTNRSLFPANSVEPQYMDCPSNPPYMVKQIHLSTLDPSSGMGTNSVIGELVQVPLAVNIGSIAPNYVPIGGPGGHLSLLLNGAPRQPSLDSGLQGLQALASPMFGRMRDTKPIGYYPVVPQAVAVQRFKAMFPAEMQVSAGTPVMVYYLGFPDSPQDAMMPTWTFPDATGVISGTVVNLKETTLPGVEGFAPQVDIQSPVDGTVLMQGQSVSLTFSITGAPDPFTYTVSADDSVIASGVTISGTHTLNLPPLPALGGRPEGHTLSVHAVNSYNIAGDDSVFLGTFQNVYLPLVVRSGSALAPAAPSQPTDLAPDVPDYNLYVGVEWVMNYHDPAHNLSLTKADAEGFYNWLPVAGWHKSFDYGNDAAWEKDWRDCTLGGIDCSIGVDRAQFVYFSGHGSPSSWYFGVKRDYQGAWGGNARFQNVRWAAFSSCNTIRGGYYVGPGDPPLTDWFNSFKGSYMLLGFHSTMKDVAFGGNFAINLYNPMYILFPSMQPSIRAAWVNTAFQMNAGKPAYLYAVGNLNPVNYKLPRTTYQPPLTGITQFRWVWWDE